AHYSPAEISKSIMRTAKSVIPQSVPTANGRAHASAVRDVGSNSEQPFPNLKPYLENPVNLSKQYMKIKQINGHLAVLPLVAAALAVSALNGRCANPLYPAVVKGDGALGYYRFNDSTTRSNINVNSGSLGAAGDATNDLATFTGGVVHSIPGAIVGDPDRAAFFDFTTRTEIPW